MIDISCITDLDPFMSTITNEREAIAQAVARRLQTPRGRLYFHPDYGFDVKAYLNADITPARLSELAQNVQAEVLKDERISSAKVDCSQTTVENIRIALQLTTSDGPMRLALNVNDVTVELIRGIV